MQLLVEAASQVGLTDELRQQLENRLHAAVGRHADQITRVQVFLTDVNSTKGGIRDKRCVIEARPAGVQPLAVNHQAPSVELAVDGACDKLSSLLGNTLGRLGEGRRRGAGMSEEAD